MILHVRKFVTLIYIFLHPRGKRFPEFFLRKGLTLGKELLLSLAGPDNQLLAMAQESEKNVKEN